MSIRDTRNSNDRVEGRGLGHQARRPRLGGGDGGDAMASSGSRCAATGSSADAHGARTTFTRAEVAARASAGASVFIVDGDVIDFGGFAHPGGHAILRRHAGEDVSAVFRGKQAGEGRRYAHSDAATRTLRRLRVGTIETVEAAENDDEPPSGVVANVATKPRVKAATKTAARESAPVAASFERDPACVDPKRDPAIGWRWNGVEHERGLGVIVGLLAFFFFLCVYPPEYQHL